MSHGASRQRELMAHSPLDTPSSDAPRLRDVNPVFAAIARVDDGLYRIERAVVTAAMLIMSGTVCLNIYYQFLTGQRAVWRRMQAGTEDPGSLVPSVALAAILVLLFRAAASAAPALRDMRALHWILGAIGTAAAIALGAAMLTLSSAAVCQVLMVLVGIYLFVLVLGRPVPARGPLVPPGTIAGLIGVLLGTAGGIVLAGRVPEGYTWAQKLALFLLLWVAFIGASMATHDQRHLMVDAVRKAVPARFLPWFNALSWMTAAVFTAGFFYLSWIYLQLRLGEDPTPGEIPDWLKVLSIPVSLALVTVRFAGQAIASAIAGALGLHASASTPQKA